MRLEIVSCFYRFFEGLTDQIGGLMVSELTSSVVDCGFEPRSGQIKDYKIGICSFSAMHTALRRKSKDGLAQNQDNLLNQKPSIFFPFETVA